MKSSYVYVKDNFQLALTLLIGCGPSLPAGSSATLPYHFFLTFSLPWLSEAESGVRWPPRGRLLRGISWGSCQANCMRLYSRQSDNNRLLYTICRAFEPLMCTLRGHSIYIQGGVLTYQKNTSPFWSILDLTTFTQPVYTLLPYLFYYFCLAIGSIHRLSLSLL